MEDLMSRYYKIRDIMGEVDYDTYWKEIKHDPDGIIRDRLSPLEYNKFVANAKEEIRFLNGLEGGRILDIGCGVGYMLRCLGSQWQKYGIELSEFAAKFASRFGEIYIGKLESQNFSAELFDAVILYHVIEHVGDPVSLVEEIYKILKQGGVLLLGMPDFDSACARLFGDNYRMLHDATHISLFSRKSMCNMLRDYNFYIDRIECPFFDTEYFTKENLLRLLDTTKMSPPFYGNFLTFYCYKGGKYENRNDW
jgi:SAM-dependent methyltransferase